MPKKTSGARIKELEAEIEQYKIKQEVLVNECEMLAKKNDGASVDERIERLKKIIDQCMEDLAMQQEMTQKIAEQTQKVLDAYIVYFMQKNGDDVLIIKQEDITECMKKELKAEAIEMPYKGYKLSLG